MIFKPEDQAFLEKLAPTRTGKQLLDVLHNTVTFYADVRNMGDSDPKVRIEALKFFQDFIDKLTVLGQKPKEKPEEDEFR